ncbi:uncharacterized protein LOC128990803 [Macrosteles quadrilineatus]|uniref:uncharacterized protein LOC128990697 n=1 Tax=Macrosteles quadrilineatus TaxID=74068 RepID=UPI0023E34B06|nr:uncharacterized protein LOC128990697 [Macrosteles quadrilineatus]XP_054269362.1 uncharacterized protein LOC128990803 [Macrosteles quadrilineatus]
MGSQFYAKDRVCDRKEMIKRVRKVIDDLDSAKVEARCCCTDPGSPPAGTKLVTPQTLDGEAAVPRVVSANKAKYIWTPPATDNRQHLDATMSCYSATVANQFYDELKGCRLDCGVSKGEGGGPTPHSHWWNAPGKVTSPKGVGPDYCEDPEFVPPEPLGHMAWTNEPGGTCRYPQYCKAHCFDHAPERDWSRHY